MPETGSLVDQGQPFTDAKKRQWFVKITVAGIRRVKEALNVNLFKLSENKFAGLAELLDDELQLVNVIYVLCRDQLAAQNITDEQFGESLDGEAFGRAADAFLQAYINFSPDPRIRAALGSLKTKGLAALNLILTDAEKEIEKATPESMATQLRERFTTSPASSAATPTPTVFDPSRSWLTVDDQRSGDAGRDGSQSTPARTG
jgi:hypothetical protein